MYMITANRLHPAPDIEELFPHHAPHRAFLLQAPCHPKFPLLRFLRLKASLPLAKLH